MNHYPHPKFAFANFDLPTRGRLAVATIVPQSPPPPCGEVEGDANRLRVGVWINSTIALLAALKSVIIIVGLTILFSHVVAADDRVMIDLGAKTRSMHPQPQTGKIPIEPAFEDYSYMLFDNCKAAEINCMVYPMMGELNNAVAFINGEGLRIIVYDRRLSPKIGYQGAQAVIAHELGHHYCQHLGKRAGISRHVAEIEADRFMGFVMKRFKVPAKELVKLYKNLGINTQSKTHPSIEIRAYAISEGAETESLSSICPGQDLN